MEILRALRERYGAAHRLKISDEGPWWPQPPLAIATSNDRFLPDKAIDLGDEAAAGAPMNSKLPPPQGVG